jgi:hypothetical protein
MKGLRFTFIHLRTTRIMKKQCDNADFYSLFAFTELPSSSFCDGLLFLRDIPTRTSTHIAAITKHAHCNTKYCLLTNSLRKVRTSCT